MLFGELLVGSGGPSVHQDESLESRLFGELLVGSVALACTKCQVAGALVVQFAGWRRFIAGSIALLPVHSEREVLFMK